MNRMYVRFMKPHKPSPRDEALGALAAAADDLAQRIGAAATVHRSDRHTDELQAAATLLTAVDRLTAAIIAVLQAADHHQVIAEHGVTRDTWLRAIAGRTGSDAGMLLAAAERLADMPAVTAWFQQGALSWGAVRQIVASTRNLTAAQRAWVDATLADHEADVSRLDGDQVAAAVDGLAAQARPDLQRGREKNALSRRWLSIQPRLDGTADIHGTLDPETAAAALAAFTTTPTDHQGGDGGRGNESSDGDGMSDGDRARAAKRRTNVDVFGDLCRQRVTRNGPPQHADADAEHIDVDHDDDAENAAHQAQQSTGAADDRGADSTDSGTAPGDAADVPADARPSDSRINGGSCKWCGSAPSIARPAFLVVADLAARLLWATDRGPVELTPAAAQRLACDAALRVVITDDTQILGVSAAHPKVSATLRAALVVRDNGCRFPGCSQPPDRCDNHHVVPVIDNGPTVLENLALVCRDHHHAIHDSGWQVGLDVDGVMTFTRRGVTLVTQPRVRQDLRPTSPPPKGAPRRRRPPPPDPEAGSEGSSGLEPEPAVCAGQPGGEQAPVLLPF